MEQSLKVVSLLPQVMVKLFLINFGRGPFRVTEKRLGAFKSLTLPSFGPCCVTALVLMERLREVPPGALQVGNTLLDAMRRVWLSVPPFK